MHRKIVLGTVAVAGLTLLAACNRETASNSAPPTDATAIQAAQNDPVPGSKDETVSAVKGALAGAVGAVSAELTTSTKGFVDGAAVGDMYEVQAGQLASMRASMPELKKFAKDMVDTHTQTTSQLKSILVKVAANVVPPSELDGRHQAMLDDLKGAKDEDFDGRYIAQQIDTQNEALILMRGYAKDGDHADIKAFAAETQPKVQMHLDMIHDIDRKHRAADAQARNSGSDGTTR
jgi:putative membrane protein